MTTIVLILASWGLSWLYIALNYPTFLDDPKWHKDFRTWVAVVILVIGVTIALCQPYHLVVVK